MQNNIIILPAGKTADDDIYRYNNGNQTLAPIMLPRSVMRSASWKP